MKKIIVTGGAGYIGSHTCTLLAQQGYQLLVIDNLVRGKKYDDAPCPVRIGDMTDKAFLHTVFEEFKPDCVIHLAALCNPSESLRQPEAYYRSHVTATETLLETMLTHAVKNIIFASSSTLYADKNYNDRYVETDACTPTNPYSSGKFLSEQAIIKHSETFGLRYVIMRHFNPSGVDGIDACLATNHAMSALVKASLGITPGFTLYGTDYPTPDGSSIRDYIHVTDIAAAHARALHYLASAGESLIVNIGSSHGTSLKELLARVEKKCGKPIEVDYQPRMAIHRGYIVSDSSLAQQRLRWVPERSLDNIIDSTIQWFTHNKRHD